MILKLNSSGNAVFELQKMLAAKGCYPGVADSKFGMNTKQAVIAFQKKNKLNADGIVGSITWKALFGTEMPVPKMPKTFTQEECFKLFGDPHESSFAPTWLVTHIVDLGFKTIKIYMNKVMIPALDQAVANLKAAKLEKEWRTYDGCYVLRFMRGGSSLSIHSWGLAIDINAATNPFGSEGDMSEGFAKCFEKAGFTWGGRWSYPDFMHMQVPKVR